MSAAAARDRFLARAHGTGVLRVGLRSAQVRPLLDVHRANARAKAAHRPRPGGGRLTFFHPRASSEPTNGWPALAGEPIEVHEMAADHCSMPVPPAVAGLADRLRSWFERSLDTAPTVPRAADCSPAAFAPQAAETRS